MSSDEDAPETGKEKFYEADDVEEIYIEVMLQDEDRNDYVYWLKRDKLPEDEDEIDWAIEEAKKFHQSKGLPEIPEDPDDFDEEPYATAYEPFSRYSTEFTFLP